MMLSVLDNKRIRGNTLASSVVDGLAKSLPAGWSVHLSKDGPREVTVSIATPTDSAQLRACAVPDMSPRDAKALSDRAGTPDLVLARFLTPRARDHLRAAGVGYLDLTGNAYLALSRPALFIERTGAQFDPAPNTKTASLKGSKAGVVVRALCDFGPPLGIRELAARADVTPGYASRLVKLLAAETLLEREARGPVLSVDVARLLRRWSEYYSLIKSNLTRTYLDPRGASNGLGGLGSSEWRYAVSGSFAAAALAPVAAPRLLVVFVDNLDRAATDLGLRPAETGANVILAEPFDPVVYERTWQKGGVTYASPSQVVVDLLSSPGRGPNEAEELLRWMNENEDAWRVR